MKGLYINDTYYSAQSLEGSDSRPSALYAKAHKDSFLQKLALFYQDFLNQTPCMQVKTSGSTGTPKLMSVKKEYMQNSARATLNYLKLKADDSALLCMPLDYIAGKMMALRALLGELKLYTAKPGRDPFLNIDYPHHFDFIAITTMQAACILENDESLERLFACKKTIIGGGPLNADVAAILQKSPNAIYQSYAMTETLSHIALLDIRHDGDIYTLFDNVKLSLSQNGTAIIHARHLCDEDIVCNDLIELIDDRHFRVTGRIDNVINTGGIKVLAEDLEKALHGFSKRSFAISKVAHKVYGHQIVLVIEGSSSDFTDNKALEAKIEALPRYHRPKHTVFIDKIPMTETYKIKRKELEALVNKLLL